MIEGPKISDGLEEIKEKFKASLCRAEVKSIFIEDLYRLQCVLDDHARELEAFIEVADEMVKELEGLGS